MKNKDKTIEDYRNRHKVTPAVFLLLIKKNNVLLMRRFQTGFRDGEYSLVAGHVEKGESFTQAMAREAREEAGVLIKEKDLELVSVLNRWDEITGERIDLFFTARRFQNEPKNMEPDRCDDMGWFDIDHLPEFVIDFVEEAIVSYKNNIFYAETGFTSSGG